ncbi:MAG TPA: lysine--tRNA ligase [Nanoarchaeota archaeon]|nr:lysine--tRNA ligase [Candidatus Woesearchaeota archaeon]HIH14961.1 lysine--tRNA ligase [Nanoarchaeota archaeon]HIH58390.1 lysine--tRNA ligase [Nanoarchaeota archaeon]HII14094.1 lysine--tRNA ligase [Nanoarchaeota archaeon]HIJ04734.1 lysine--tRNA ligase [Nanoarchaeota archaeon]
MEHNRLAQERIEKVKKLREMGIDPYPYSYKDYVFSSVLLEKYQNLKEGEKGEEKVSIMGRIMTLREMGKASFAHIQDQEGQIQVYIREEELKNYDVFKLVDLGDILGIKGHVFKTKKGEITVWAEEFVLLSKSILPLPDKFHGLQDTEIRYRQRYVDLIANPEVKKTFLLRSKIVSAIREYLDKKGFVEVDIPVLQPVYGGANARPFKTHINAWNLDLFLSISPELYLKRLIVGGYEKVYTICKNFRNEGVDKTHNPEFTMMECYWSGVDYNDMMELTEDLYEYVAEKVLGTTEIVYQGTKISLKKPWKRLTMADALKTMAKIDVEKLSDKEIFKCIEQQRIDAHNLTRGLAIAALFEQLCEEKLIQPIFITDHPRETTPLCKLKRGDPELIERFEPYINGWEIGNGYSELTDPILQKKFLEEQVERGRGGDEEAHQMDTDFIRAMEYGMPPTGGVGIGIDRMVILLANASSIREVIFFPTMKPEN